MQARSAGFWGDEPPWLSRPSRARAADLGVVPGIPGFDDACRSAWTVLDDLIQSARGDDQLDRFVGVSLLPADAPWPPTPRMQVQPQVWLPMVMVIGILEAEGNERLASILRRCPLDAIPLATWREPDDIHVSAGQFPPFSGNGAWVRGGVA